MQLSQAQKQKFLEYVENKRLMLESKSNKFIPQNLFEDMIADILLRTQRKDSQPVFEEYIFTHAIQNVEELLEPQDKETLSVEVTADNWIFVFGELLSNDKYLLAFVAGYIFGYSKLCYKLKLEPQDKFLSITNVLATF
ncbi:MAG: hypothetical protein WCK98_01525 [bacterium]